MVSKSSLQIFSAIKRALGCGLPVVPFRRKASIAFHSGTGVSVNHSCSRIEGKYTSGILGLHP